ncbi:MAG: cupin domain-containing protein [Solirubrobacteraceae bacterium]
MNDGLIVKSLDQAEQTRAPSERGRVDMVLLGEVTVGRAVFQPGWRWSVDFKAAAGTDLCQVTHTGYVVSGRERVRMADGMEVELGPGDAFLIGPGHDAWVIGDEPCVTVDFSVGGASAAAPSREEER